MEKEYIYIVTYVAVTERPYIETETYRKESDALNAYRMFRDHIKEKTTTGYTITETPQTYTADQIGGEPRNHYIAQYRKIDII